MQSSDKSTKDKEQDNSPLDVKPLGITAERLTEGGVSAELKEATGRVLSAMVSGDIPLSDVIDMLGITAGRDLVELARIAYAPGDEALTAEEVLRDGAIRKVLTNREMSKGEMILTLQEAYKNLANPDIRRIKVTAHAKIMAMKHLRQERWRISAERKNSQQPGKPIQQNNVYDFRTTVSSKTADGT